MHFLFINEVRNSLEWRDLVSRNGKRLPRNVGSACQALLLHPVGVRVVARVVRVGMRAGKGEVQVGPRKHGPGVIGLNLRFNLSEIFARCN